MDTIASCLFVYFTCKSAFKTLHSHQHHKERSQFRVTFPRETDCLIIALSGREWLWLDIWPPQKKPSCILGVRNLGANMEGMGNELKVGRHRLCNPLYIFNHVSQFLEISMFPICRMGDKSLMSITQDDAEWSILKILKRHMNVNFNIFFHVTSP